MPRKTNAARIQEIMEDFDFRSVQIMMMAQRERWGKGPVTIAHLRETALMALREVTKRNVVGVYRWAFTARRHEPGECGEVLTLSFDPESISR